MAKNDTFSCQMETVVFIVLQLFFTALMALKIIGEYHSDIPQLKLYNIQSHDTFRPMPSCDNIGWIKK